MKKDHMYKVVIAAMAVFSVFAVAALIAAGTYAYTTFIDTPEKVQAAGVDSAAGWDVTPLGVSRQGGFFVITKYAKDPTTSEPRHTITVYELVKKGKNGDADLFYVGSRVIDHDAGLPMIKFNPDADSDYSPLELKKIMEKAAKGGSKKRR